MKNEIKNNIVHMFLGSFFAGIVFLCYSPCLSYVPVIIIAHVAVFILSVCIEIFQFFAWDDKDFRIVDRIFDIIGYQIGVGLIDLYTRYMLG